MNYSAPIPPFYIERHNRELAEKALRDYIASMAEIADILENADRIGADKDEPEGTRYIQISDTLARDLVAKLRNRLT